MTPRLLLLRVGLAASRSLRHFPSLNGDLPYAETWLVRRTPPLHHITSHHITGPGHFRGLDGAQVFFMIDDLQLFRRPFALRYNFFDVAGPA